jgi:MFS family permease
MNARAIAPTLPPPKAQIAGTGRSSLPALYAGNGLTLSGLRLQTMIFAWIALEAAGEGWVGLINGLPVIAACMFGAWGGLLADSPGARRAMTAIRSGLASIALVAAALAAAGLIAPIVLLTLGMLLGGLTAMDTPIARSLLFYATGDRPLLKVTSTNSLVLNALNIAGPALAGVILSRYGGSAALLLLAAAYLCAALLSRTIAVSPPESGTRRTVSSELTAGFRYLRSDHRLGWLMSLVLIVPLAGTFFAIVPLYARDVLDIGPAGYGLLIACYGAGNLSGSAYLAAGNRFERRGPAILTLGLLYGACMVSFALASGLVVCCAIAAAMGAIAMLWQNLLSTTIQKQAPAEIQGRVMSIYTMGIQLLGLGWLINAGMSLVIDIRLGLVITGLLAIALNLIAAKRSDLLRLR